MAHGENTINGDDWRNRSWITMLALSLALHAAAGLLVPVLAKRAERKPAPERVVFVDLAAVAPAPGLSPAAEPGSASPETEPEVVPLDVPPPPSGYIATIRIAPTPPAAPPPAPVKPQAPPARVEPPPAPPAPKPGSVTFSEGAPGFPVRSTVSAREPSGQGLETGGPDSGAAGGAAKAGAETGQGSPAGDRTGTDDGLSGAASGSGNRIFKKTEVDVIPKPTFRPDPPISRRARRLGIEEGEAKALIRVSPDGRVTDVSLVSENPEGITDEAFLATLRSWLFTPGIKAGRPVTVEMIQSVRFVRAAP
ncbi:MAG: energy transducer TonB [Deltaproteobacteria bacterium]|nr:energy transducer TonB [Deltaproteobacteria bacterium]